MKYLLRISHEAYVDLRAATDYIADDAPSRAERFASEFFEIANKLCQFPKLGRLRDDLNPGWRSIGHYDYVIVYEVRYDCVIVLRIVHGSRDLRTAFNK